MIPQGVLEIVTSLVGSRLGIDHYWQRGVGLGLLGCLGCLGRGGGIVALSLSFGCFVGCLGFGSLSLSLACLDCLVCLFPSSLILSLGFGSLGLGFGSLGYLGAPGPVSLSLGCLASAASALALLPGLGSLSLG